MGAAGDAAGFAATTGAAALRGVFTVGLAVGLVGVFATGLGVGLGDALDVVLARGLGASFATGLAGALAAFSGLLTTLATTFATGLGFATGFAGTLVTALTAAFTGFAGFASGFAEALGFAVSALDWLAFPDVAFTWSLLAGWACMLFVAPLGVSEVFVGLSGEISSARECTGLPTAKPISCKIETIISLPAMFISMENRATVGAAAAH